MALKEKSGIWDGNNAIRMDYVEMRDLPNYLTTEHIDKY